MRSIATTMLRSLVSTAFGPMILPSISTLPLSRSRRSLGMDLSVVARSEKIMRPARVTRDGRRVAALTATKVICTHVPRGRDYAERRRS